MTGEHHDQDALITALRSPALQREHVGEEAAVAAMLGALSADTGRQDGNRSRRGIAIAAVTVASLGVGGLVAAGPGIFFFPAADRPPATAPSTPAATSVQAVDATAVERNVERGLPTVTSVTTSTLGVDGLPAQSRDGDAGASQDTDGCEATHGDAVSDVARSTVPGEQVKDAARSDCGKPDDRESPSDTAPGQTGQSPSDTAPGQTGQSPSDTAPGQTGQSPSDTAPGPGSGSAGNGRP